MKYKYCLNKVLLEKELRIPTGYESYTLCIITQSAFLQRKISFRYILST